jgi:mannose-1-phosphate guanylyltransferase
MPGRLGVGRRDPPTKALVLVGGLGTRLRPVTYSLPKQLIPLAGRPMLYHVLELLPPEVDEVILASGYKGDVLQEYVSRHPPRWKTRVVTEPTPLGTGGGIRFASAGLSDPFLLLNSDVICNASLGGLVALQAARGGVGAMTLFEVQDTRPFGVAALDAQDRITAFVEKPEPEAAPSHWVNAGMSIWSRAVVDEIPDGRPVSWEKEIVPTLLPRGIFGYRFQGYWEDAGTPERLLLSQKLLFADGRGGSGLLPTEARGRGPVAVDAEAEVDGAEFGGNVHVGPRVSIGAGAYIENSIVMEGATVGPGASVVGSILGPGIQVAAGQEVRGQVLGQDAPI